MFVLKESSPLVLRNMPIEISLLSEMRKKLLDIEQIILDLKVLTYISLIHPLNSLSPNSNTP